MHLNWRLVAPGNGPAISTSITLDETAELQRLAYQSDVLEIGAAYGYSAIVMALAGAKVTSIDPHNVHLSFDVMRANLGDYGLTDQVSIWRGYSQEVLPSLVSTGQRFDVVFIDGDHTKAGVTHDVSWALRLLRPGGILACHDYTEACCCPEVGPALDLLFTDPPLSLVDTLYVVRP